jgi:formylmethanofuran dehydrogenase subunit E
MTSESYSEATHRSSDPIERKLDEVAAIHGAPGPWAVAGYRMSEHALAKLGLPRGSFDLEIVHWTPKEVRYSCIADGAAAHSGASLGKLNLSLVESTADNVVTIYRDKKSGKSIALRPAASFRERYADTPRQKARELGREVLGLPPEQVFEEILVR